jgi:hypothetical protein
VIQFIDEMLQLGDQAQAQYRVLTRANGDFDPEPYMGFDGSEEEPDAE